MTFIKTKKPGLLSAGLYLIFILIGIRNLQKALVESSTTLQIILAVTGGLSILLFGFLLVIYLQRLLNTKSGLVFTEDQLIFRPNGFQNVIIPWSAIETIRTETRKNVLYILPILKNPEQLIEEQHGFGKRLMQTNLRQLGTPIPVFAHNYEIASTDLLKLFESHLPS